MSLLNNIRSTFHTKESPLYKALKAVGGFLILVLVAVVIHSVTGIASWLSIVIVMVIVIAWIGRSLLVQQR